MSNSWAYDLFVDNSRSSRERLESLLQTLRSHQVRRNSGGAKEQFCVLTESGDEFKFDSETDWVNFLSLNGGLFDAWMPIDPDPEGDVGFSVNYDLKSRWDPLSSDQYAYTIGRISLDIAACYYRSSAGDYDRVLIAPFMKNIFKSLCLEQDAIYGYSVDEYTYEALGLDWPVPALVDGVPVPTLYWLNYFSNRYLSRIGLKDMKSLGGMVEEVQSGVFISFFHHPWEVETSFQKLIDVNAVWKQLAKLK